MPNVELEIERDEGLVVVSGRSPEGNFVLTLPLDGATTFSAATNRAVDEDNTSGRSRFIIAKARLEVSK
jgi:hypothetical protein